MSTIDAEEVRRAVSLAWIAFIEDGITKIAAGLRVIFNVVAKVFRVATPDVLVTSHPIPLTNV